MMLSSKILILAVCLFGVSQLVQSNKVEDQIRRIFHREKVPKYHGVNIKTAEGHRLKRELRPVEFEVDGEKVKLHLTPMKNNVMYDSVPVWTVETAQNRQGNVYNTENNKLDGIFYEDPEKMATLLAYYKDRQIYYDGVYGESKLTKVVRSIREKWWLTPGTDGSINHVVFDVDENKHDTQIIGEADQSSNQEKLPEPLDTLYPKLLIVVDHNLFKDSGEDVNEMMKYVLTFWNAVNLKYSKLSQPKVRIIVTGIIIVKDPTALKFIYNNRNQTDMNKLNPNKMILDQGKYFKDVFRSEMNFNNFDSSIVMTNLDTGMIAGAAYIGTVCSPDTNVGYINDDGSYSGLQSATHELGHLLSLPHDGGGKAKDCTGYPDENHATIMAPFIASVEKFQWSKCSRNILQTFSTLKKAECLRHPYRR